MSASTGPDIQGMATFIAQQIHNHVAPDENWDDLTEDDQAQFKTVALVAAGAHDAWLTLKGFRIVAPGTVIVPQSREEAGAMLRACEGYLKKAKAPIALPPKRKLIVPGN